MQLDNLFRNEWNTSKLQTPPLTHVHEPRKNEQDDIELLRATMECGTGKIIIVITDVDPCTTSLKLSACIMEMRVDHPVVYRFLESRGRSPSKVGAFHDRIMRTAYKVSNQTGHQIHAIICEGTIRSILPKHVITDTQYVYCWSLHWDQMATSIRDSGLLSKIKWDQDNSIDYRVTEAIENIVSGKRDSKKDEPQCTEPILLGFGWLLRTQDEAFKKYLFIW